MRRLGTVPLPPKVAELYVDEYVMSELIGPGTNGVCISYPALEDRLYTKLELKDKYPELYEQFNRFDVRNTQYVCIYLSRRVSTRDHERTHSLIAVSSMGKRREILSSISKMLSDLDQDRFENLAWHIFRLYKDGSLSVQSQWYNWVDEVVARIAEVQHSPDLDAAWETAWNAVHGDEGRANDLYKLTNDVRKKYSSVEHLIAIALRETGLS